MMIRKEKKMKINKLFLIILLIGIFIFYLIPCFAFNMNGADANNYASICILFINSLYIIVSAILLTKKNGFKWYYMLIILLFIPSVILYFNKTTLIYILLYIVEYLFSCGLCIKYSNR